MPYADPEKQRLNQQQVQRDRSRGAPFYRALLVWAANRRTPKGYTYLGRLTRMVDRELRLRAAKGIELPRWPTQREEELLRAEPNSSEPEKNSPEIEKRD